MQAERCRMILGREESLPEVPSVEEVGPMPEAVAEHCAAIEVKGNFMFDPVRCSTSASCNNQTPRQLPCRMQRQIQMNLVHSSSQRD